MTNYPRIDMQEVSTLPEWKLKGKPFIVQHPGFKKKDPDQFMIWIGGQFNPSDGPFKNVEAAEGVLKKRIAQKIFREYHEASDLDNYELCEQIAKEHPFVLNYDKKGNWIGPVSNENGWTP